MQSWMCAHSSWQKGLSRFTAGRLTSYAWPANEGFTCTTGCFFADLFVHVAATDQGTQLHWSFSAEVTKWCVHGQ